MLSLEPTAADRLAEAACQWASNHSTLPQEGRRQDIVLLKQVRLEWETRNLLPADHVPALEDVSGKYNFMTDKTLGRVLRLPLPQRSAVLLVYVEKLSYAETAEILETTTGDINRMLLAARMALFTHAGTSL